MMATNSDAKAMVPEWYTVTLQNDASTGHRDSFVMRTSSSITASSLCAASPLRCTISMSFSLRTTVPLMASSSASRPLNLTVSAASAQSAKYHSVYTPAMTMSV